MKVAFRSFLAMLAVSVLLGSCSSGKKALEQGDYPEAVRTAVDRLRKSPNNDKAREVLARAYPRLLSYNLDRIRKLRNSRDELRWEKILPLYRQLNRAYDEIQRSPAASRVIPDARYFQEAYENAQFEAAKARYEMGRQALAAGRQNDWEAAKQAYYDFSRAQEFVPGFRDAAQLADEARSLATVYVVVAPIRMPSKSMEVSNEFFYNKLMEYLRSSRISPFVEFYGQEEAASVNLRPDQYVRLAFDEFAMGNAYIQETVEERSRDSVVIGQVEVEEGEETVQKDVYGTVKAEVHLFEKRLNANAVLDCRILEAQGQTIIAQEKFANSFTWVDYWGYYNGDERALSDQDQRRTRNRREVYPPPPQDLFVEVTAGIYDKVANYLSVFYHQY